MPKYIYSYLDQLNAAPDRWSIGLRLFFESNDGISKFYGLRLVRDFLSSSSLSSVAPEIRSQIKNSLMVFIQDSLKTDRILELFIKNSLVTIVTLCIKFDFPELWPTAFVDILSLARIGSSAFSSVAGLDIAVGILSELDVEVVAYNIDRTQEEVAHNIVVKDALRDGPLCKEVMTFLCSSVVSSRQEGHVEMSEKCLRVLAQMIGWTDVNLTVSCALSTVYQALQDAELRGAACTCLFEVAKKGMDPISKLQLINSIGLVQWLVAVPIAGATGVGLSGEDDEDDGTAAELGPLVDILFCELLGMWLGYEKVQTGYDESQASSSSTAKNDPVRAKTSGNSKASVGAAGADVGSALTVDAAPVAAAMLRALMPSLMGLFGHPQSDVYASVTTALNKLIMLLKQQTALRGAGGLAGVSAETGYFLAEDYLTELLSAIYKQLQYAPDFKFDVDDEDDSAVIEVSE